MNRNKVAPPRAARRAVMATFFINGMALGNWFPRIPAVQEDLGLSEGELGLALLGPAVGAVATMPTIGWLIARFGSRPVTRASALTLCAALPLPALAPNLALLALALVVVGVGNGVLDVAMNTQAVAVERRYRRPIMTTFHGLFSVGSLTGGALAGVVAWRGIDVTPHLLGVAAVLVPAAIVASRWLLPADIDAGQSGPKFVRPSRTLAGLGIVAFGVLLGEGAMGDWGAVYLKDSLDTSEGLAAAGFVLFSLTMAAGRLLGDRLTLRLGPVTMVRAGGTLAAVGLGLGLLVNHPIAALIGFACVGAGLSSLFPITLSAAGRIPGVPPGPALAAVSMMGYTAFLAGPPVIGFIAEVTGLRGALGVVVLLCAAAAALAGAVGRSGAVQAGATREAAPTRAPTPSSER